MHVIVLRGCLGVGFYNMQDKRFMDRFHCVANDTTMIPALLRAQGYRTHAIGEKQCAHKYTFVSPNTRICLSIREVVRNGLNLTCKYTFESHSRVHAFACQLGMSGTSRSTAHPRTEALRLS